MSSVWGASVRRSLDEAVELLARVVQDCPDDLWRVPMWRVDPSEIVGETRDVDGNLVTEPAQREALVQRWSTPWSVSWHALEVLDYDLAGELEAWAPRHRSPVARTGGHSPACVSLGPSRRLASTSGTAANGSKTR